MNCNHFIKIAMIRNNQPSSYVKTMPARLNYTHEDFLNLFIIYGECDKVISRNLQHILLRFEA